MNMKNSMRRGVFRIQAAALCLLMILTSSMPAFADTEVYSEGVTIAGIQPLSGGLTPFQAKDEITNLTVSVSHEAFQTYDDLDAHTTPADAELIVTLGVTVSEDYTAGGTIELPLNFIPNLTTHPTFTHGTDGAGLLEPFFVMQTPEAHDMVKLYDTVTKPGFLVIRLKSKGETGFSSGLSTLAFRFDFNMNWVCKIPPDTLLWQVAPVAYVNGDEAVKPTPKRVNGGADNQITFGFTRFTPPTANYESGALTCRFNT
jgi:hypothetical protein